ncbi:MAG: phosphotransferase [Sedimenticolaceae bacterium]|nr:phosphotransferase [Sedimenticolaceae bacterium]
MTDRLEQLVTWLSDQPGLRPDTLEQVAGDASFRRYYRVLTVDGVSRIVMDAPPEHEDCHPFVDVTGRLETAGVHVPHIHAQDLEQGFLLLEDLGDIQYLDRLDQDSAARLYGDALHALRTFQASAPPDGLPPYDEALLRFEMELFREWLCTRHLGLELDVQENAMLDTLFTRLVENALEQPQLFVHRDYHSRNLMLTASNSPGIIDFQDAVRGPITYDLVSLLKDAYIRWPLEQVDSWVEDYVELALQSGLIDAAGARQFQRWFDLMGLQRHIKVAGIFARLYRRDGKAGYLADIPLVLDYIVEMADRYPAFSSLADLITLRVRPALRLMKPGGA